MLNFIDPQREVLFSFAMPEENQRSGSAYRRAPAVLIVVHCLTKGHLRGRVYLLTRRLQPGGFLQLAGSDIFVTEWWACSFEFQTNTCEYSHVAARFAWREHLIVWKLWPLIQPLPAARHTSTSTKYLRKYTYIYIFKSTLLFNTKAL